MKSFTTSTNIKEFTQFIAEKKANWKDWQLCIIKIDESSQNFDFEELEQFVQFYLTYTEIKGLKLTKSKELILFSRKEDGLEFPKFDRAVKENFADAPFTYVYGSVDSKHLELVSNAITPHIAVDDSIALISLARMCRQGANIMVVDDDPMIRKQMEKMLFGYGDIRALDGIRTLREDYISFAPDIMFLDIHLGGIRGNKILKKLRADIDPDAYVVMISSDSSEDTLQEIKAHGANGFLMKPLNRNKIYQYLTKVPTIATKRK